MTITRCVSWFAVQVSPRAEKKVADHLTYKGYQSFLPLYKATRRWSDRKTVLELPLFPGYVFCRMTESSAGLIVATPGAVRIVGFGGKPYPVSDTEIGALQQIVESGIHAVPFVPYLRIGERVEIKDGPLSGITGIIVQIKNQRRLVVSVDAVMKSISIDVDAYEVSNCPPRSSFTVPPLMAGQAASRPIASNKSDSPI